MYENHQWDAAGKYMQQAYSIAKEIGFPHDIKGASELLYKNHQRKENWKEAFFYHKEYIEMRDSVINEDNKKEAFKQKVNYEYENKKKRMQLF